MNELNAVILAAGLGTRLARPIPKALTRLSSGETIIERQLRCLHGQWGDDVRVAVVVGFKLDLVMEAVPDEVFVYNEQYDRTNTSRSLLKALRAAPRGTGVMWMNGDVVFDPGVLERFRPLIDAGRSCVAVDNAQVGQEEVTYTMRDGVIAEIGKGLADGRGEAVGINYVSAQDRPALERRLSECDDQDYFERGVEWTITRDGTSWLPVDVSDLYAVEVDFESDLYRVNADLRRPEAPGSSTGA